MNIGGVSVRCTVVYRCPPFQNLHFHRTFFLDFGEFPRRFDETDAIPAPEACCDAESNHTSVFACPELPLDNPIYS